MGKISASSVFHFTKDFDDLLYILKRGRFDPRCVIEERKGEKTAIPMVCFCDLPLSQIEGHIKKYGYYGLGLTKKWALQHNIAPVMYEAINQSGMNAFDALIKTGEAFKDKELLERIAYFRWYMKSYDGYDRSKEFIQFYNEREWRYIPSFDALQREGYNPTCFTQSLEEAKSSFNKEQLESLSLPFQLKDISYFFLCQYEEVEKLSSVLNSNSVKKMELLSRIIWTNDLLKDF